MDVQDLIGRFLASEHGAQATSALQNLGISSEAAQSYLGHAAEAVHGHVNEHAESGGLFGEHPGRNFFAAFAAGIVKGDGVLGALKDGALGVVTGRVAEAPANKAGLDAGTASTIAAAATPYVSAFLREHLGV